jgi:hypothetical protein
MFRSGVLISSVHSQVINEHPSHLQLTDLLEVRKQILPSPTRITQFLPSVIISRGTSGEEHAVDDSAATDYGTGVKYAGTVVQTGLWDTCISSHVLVRNWEARCCGTVLLAVAMSCISSCSVSRVLDLGHTHSRTRAQAH